jgi:hypothetical protein
VPASHGRRSGASRKSKKVNERLETPLGSDQELQHRIERKACRIFAQFAYDRLCGQGVCIWLKTAFLIDDDRVLFFKL